MATAPRSGKPPGPWTTTRASGSGSRPDRWVGSTPSAGRGVSPVSDRSSHSLFTTALKSLATAGAGSPSASSPSEGLADRIAGDPTATRTPLPWFGGTVAAAWETPPEGTTPGLVAAGSGELPSGAVAEPLSGWIAELGRFAAGPGAAVALAGAAWRLTHNW